ncbi:MAG: aminopeptidase P family N-terminal domain-containing protein, partial [Pseudomonadota bacterium]
MTQAETARPDTLHVRNGDPAWRPFDDAEYAARVAGLRAVMARAGAGAVVLTSMHSIAYYSGFLYCAFGRPYAMVVTATRAVVVAALVDGGQPGRRSAWEVLTYSDWRRDNYWRAVAEIAAPNGAAPRRIGVEGDHLTLAAAEKLADFLGAPEAVDIAPGITANNPTGKTTFSELGAMVQLEEIVASYANGFDGIL